MNNDITLYYRGNKKLPMNFNTSRKLDINPCSLVVSRPLYPFRAEVN